MPYSSDENKDWIVSVVNKLNVETILDVGPGAGIYGKLFKNYEVDAVEIFEPYITRFNLQFIYTNVFCADIRKWDNFNYDLIIFGDILEHMSVEEARTVWEKSHEAKFAIISVPIVHYPQGESEGNPYEKHVKDNYTVDEILANFDGIIEYKTFEVTGAFLAKFGEK